ncbi:F0F1 ATP synthase subunit B family protein [Desulfocastanea catecholica]
MNRVKHIASLASLLTVTLWFALSFGLVYASEPTAHAPAADQAVTAENGHGAEAGAHAVPNSLSAAKIKDLGWRVVNFIALMIILVKFGAKPIGAGLSSRRKKIKDEIETLEMKRIEAENSYNAFQAKLATVESEIDKVVERAIAQAEVEKIKILEKAEQGAADLMRSAEMAVQNQVTEARRTLKNEVAEQAAILAEEIIVKNLTVDDQVKIIETYLDKVGAVQ